MTPDYFQRLAQIESGGNPLAANPNSSARGLYQFIDSTAKQYGLDQSQFGTPEYTAAEEQAVRKFTQDNYNALKSGLGREPTQGELYLAHQQGAGGALKMLSNPDAPAASLVGEQAISLNAGRPDMTAQEFASQWTSKFEPQGGEGQDVIMGQSGADDLSSMSDEELLAALGQAPQDDVSQLSDEELLAAIGQAPQQEPRSEQNLFERIGGDIENRMKMASEIKAAQQAGLQSTPETIFQSLGKIGAGTVGDIAGELGVSAFRALPDIIEQPIRGLGSAVAQSAPAQALGGLFSETAQKYGELAQESPRAARNVEALGNLGAMFVPIKGGSAAQDLGRVVTGAGKLAAKPVTATVRGAKALTGEIKDIVKKPPAALTSQEVEAASSAAYKRADDLGGIIKPEKASEFGKRVILEMTPQTPEGKLIAGKSEFGEFTNRLKKMTGMPVSLQGANEIDQFFTETINKFVDTTTGKLSGEGQKYLEVQDKFRDMITSVSEKDVIGSKEGFEALKDARGLWAKQRALSDIERIIENSQYCDRPDRAIKNGFAQLARNPKRMRGFNKTEQEAIKKAAKDGKIQEFLRGPASRLFGIVAGSTGGPKGYAVAKGAEIGARGISERAALRRAQNVLGTISQRGISQPLPTAQMINNIATQTPYRPTLGDLERYATYSSLYANKEENK